MSWLFTTGWGATYMVAVLALMGGALAFPKVRLFAGVMFGLWVADRAAVNVLEPWLALRYLAYAYTLCGVALLTFHWGKISIVVASMLLITAIAFGFGSFGYLSWDISGSIQESAGLIAMIFILWRRGDGNHIAISSGNLGIDRAERGNTASAADLHNTIRGHSASD